MGYTKRQFVTAAFEELGLADYAHDLQPQDLQMAVRRLDAMMAEWNGRGLRLGYPLVSDPENTLLDTETGVQDAANEAIITNLGIRIAPSFGRQVMQETMNTARRAYQVILSKSMNVPELQFPETLPKGAGHKEYRETNRRYFPKPSDPVDAGSDSELNFY